jgi:hypothetical protein
MAHLLEFADAAGTEKRRIVFVKRSLIQQTLTGVFIFEPRCAGVAQELPDIEDKRRAGH